MTIWLTSDEHYGHVNIITHCSRPFANVEDMNEGMVEKHNRVVKPEDTVFHLGDFALDEKYVEKYLPRLHGTHKLVPGNHDRCHSCHSKYLGSRERYRRLGFEVLEERVVMDFPFGRALLCHMPLRAVSVPYDERYLEHRPEEEELNEQGCILLLHGHVHEKWKRRRRMVNVGVDQWDFTPVSVEELGRYIKATNLE